MSTKIKYSFCNVCKHEVEDPSKKPLKRTQITIWVIVIVATLGLGAIALAIYYSTRPKDYCPECHTKLVKSDKPFEKAKKKPEDMTPREKILDKAGIEEEKSKKKDREKKGKKGKKGKKTDDKRCTECDSSMRYIEEYSKYYCDTCKDYTNPVDNTCRNCSADLRYIEEYGRWFCDKCQEYD